MVSDLLRYCMYSTHHDWPVKKANVDLPIRFNRNLKHTSSNLLSMLGALNKDCNASSKMLLTRVQ